MRRPLLVAIVVCLAAAAFYVVWRKPDLPRLIDDRTPRQKYVDGLRAAGLAETALVRDWLAAADAAMREPKRAAVPLANEVRHSPSEPQAYGYRLSLRRGRMLRVALDVEGDEPAIVFIELFAAERPSDPPLAWSRNPETTLEHEIDADGDYILRIQPELLRGGEMRIGQRTTASLTFPVSGRTSAAVKSYFRDPRDNNRREHHGIDIFAPRDTPVLAAAAGYVTHVGSSDLGGNVVWVWDADRRQSHYYAHLSKQAVQTGTYVRAGDIVGYVGNTGNARTTPPHLHFGIYSRGEGPIDPLPFVAE